MNSFQADLVKRLVGIMKISDYFGHRIDYNGVGVLIGQRHRPGKN